MDRRQFLAALPASAALRGQKASGHGLVLWYQSPAKDWTEALPVGNGRLGAMVFGGIVTERLQLNEDTLWSGFPREWNNADAKQHLAEVRRLVLEEGNYTAADQVCRKMQGPYNQSYQPLADVRLQFADTEGAAYRRELDLDTAIASVMTAGHRRETFVSFPDQVIVTRVMAAEGKQLTFRIAMDSPVKSAATVEGEATLVLRGKAPVHVDPNYFRSDNPIRYDDAEGKGMRFEARLQVLVEGGSVRAGEEWLHIAEAKAATILISAATGFRGYKQMPDLPAQQVTDAAAKHLEAAARRKYADLRARHVADHQKLFRRVSLDLGPAASALPTDQRLKLAKDRPDPQLLALYFQYGRYLLIASSRPGSQPANLQGIWNEQVRPPWSSNWTININTQMNYWHAETCNLAECHQPLFDLIEGLAENGRTTAQVNYGVEGWIAHHNADLWRQSAPVGNYGMGSPTWANWNMSAAWLCAHVWEHYLFSGDEEFLRRRAYPLLKGAAECCLGLLIPDGEGQLTTCPSISTENVFLTPEGKPAEVSAGCTMDLALLRELFAATTEAAKRLGVDEAFIARLAAAIEKLPPYRKGARGQLLEWAKDFKEREPQHRHMSHLYPLYPGAEFTPRRTPEWAQAARRSLELRLEAGGAYTGWSRAWSIGLWARLLEGEQAWEGLNKLLELSTGPNLFDTHPAGRGWIFQIDGNFGGAAAMAEMLVQSHAGEIHLLPALPKAWRNGTVRGLRARGNVEVDVAWTDGRAREVTLRSGRDGTLKLRPPQGQSFPGRTLNPDGVLDLPVARGRRYTLRLA
ncbi:MAG: glycoside hydrolase family 95 protein [Bryobacterales bacterium]|nr:glycoside hydrolase family 95 protein [Bryobacterales bacterium]